MFAYIFGHYLSTLQISYSVTSVLLDNNRRYPYFHTTIPNDEYYSVVLSKLLDHFDWQKVAIISTFDKQSALVLQSIFRALAHHNEQAHIFEPVKDLVSAELVLKSAKTCLSTHVNRMIVFEVASYDIITDFKHDNL
ncbi:PREDICTED: taste receptor type 1 member 1-like [Amphimedon queenslandica]|uniref:Receptor ligand binding region domain-containing protein n=1 Tax=Amphimedon queenslandica TaxID=400682 RepID=A0AAN0JYY9_AMPQE|nr:PREDICTED: taste receptor type 1 member 1-like [Amphimedon queenslandica]|eukprot:XP_019862126.1 PREDICTED: taste receptor type 1 member 1-like [Amphimedon queenslandica]